MKWFHVLGNGKSSSGLLEFTSVPTAVEALILSNHFTMQRDASADPFHSLEQGMINQMYTF